MKHEGKKPIKLDISELPGKGVSVTYLPGETVHADHEALVTAKKTASNAPKKGGKDG